MTEPREPDGGHDQGEAIPWFADEEPLVVEAGVDLPMAGSDVGEAVDEGSLGESPFAVGHGIAGVAPDVAVAGPAIRRARELAGVSVPQLCEELGRRGEPLDPAALTELEDRPATRLPPRRARLLAALVDRSLASVEAGAEPWPASPDALAALAAAGADVVTLGDEVVVPTASPHGYLGVLRCEGAADVLDTRTYRFAAARLLNGDWAHLAGALLVCSEAPLRAVAVDALDCVTRSHAPSGLLGFSRLAEPEPVADAVRTYDRSYATNWSDPEPLRADGPGGLVLGPPDDSDDRVVARLADLADRLGDESRRSRQAGKRPGYEQAAEVLRSLAADQVADQLTRLAAAEQVARARAQLAQLLGHDDGPDDGHDGEGATP